METSKVCNHCGKEFITIYETKEYCSTDCKLKSKDHRREAKKKILRIKNKFIPVKINCIVCGEEFVSRRPDHKSCSPKCHGKTFRLLHPSTTYTKHCLACNKEFITNNPSQNYCCTECTSRAGTVARYGLTVPEYDAIYKRQGGCCAVCGRHQDDLSSTLCVDHDHTTNIVRGLLCRGCNRGLGMLGDSLENAKRLVQYLDTK